MKIKAKQTMNITAKVTKDDMERISLAAGLNDCAVGVYAHKCILRDMQRNQALIDEFVALRRRIK